MPIMMKTMTIMLGKLNKDNGSKDNNWENDNERKAEMTIKWLQCKKREYDNQMETIEEKRIWQWNGHIHNNWENVMIAIMEAMRPMVSKITIDTIKPTTQMISQVYT
jgi:hypothetical protein